ncbi:uncharacterized protein MELLADRAFT_102926 [Melampsora larici-populina 98AG31]|uniref:Uncharacterized protein n=1 Tax=Melampsora larici-populina (strain 98AG31 / pathotype 3-4-7) TaxID=747676 RepID=F4R8M0_MELLP|nr:uncharacterized protein MELLADRAFT_102926 [Melampsora larici-populina 98AG31]EGG11042.1 hypothetical protein MELLADRAFT_102926 [Melampsora larici-populina 98AG31]
MNPHLSSVSSELARGPSGSSSPSTDVSVATLKPMGTTATVPPNILPGFTLETSGRLNGWCLFPHSLYVSLIKPPVELVLDAIKQETSSYYGLLKHSRAELSHIRTRVETEACDNASGFRTTRLTIHHLSENWKAASQGLADHMRDASLTRQRLDLLEKRFLHVSASVENLSDDLQYFQRLGRENHCLMQEKYLIIHETLRELEVQYSVLEAKFVISVTAIHTHTLVIAVMGTKQFVTRNVQFLVVNMGFAVLRGYRWRLVVGVCTLNKTKIFTNPPRNEYGEDGCTQM